MDQAELAHRFEQERGRLRSIAYRILGSLTEPPRESWRLFHARRSKQWPSRAGIPRS